MKRISTIIMALVMVMTMAQCKKNNPTAPDNHNNVVTITLDVKNNNGSRVDVNTTTGTVNFETGDKVYVGSGGKYVGFLTHNGTNFVGNITNPTENQPLQFYFLGNVTPIETLSAGTTEECSVIISDQTEHLPVISCAASFENYVSGVTSYTGHLLNKCALVKFNVTTPSNSPICITGMKNKVTVDFTQNTVTPSIDGEGVVKLPAGSGENVERWAILLPQEALEEGNNGSVYSEDGSYTGTRPTMSNISENDYLANGITITVNTAAITGVPEGAINGLFTINENGDQVYFSQGNLQYQASTNTWRFAENQWDYVGDGNANISPTYDGWIDLFGWGTSGYHDSSDPYNVNYQPWSSSTSLTNNNYNPRGYGPSVNMPSPDLTNSSANYDWGVYNPISNGGNAAGLWRTLIQSEWDYVLNTRNTTSGIRYIKAKVCNVNGLILLPDDWSADSFSFNYPNNSNVSFSDNIIYFSDWGQIESMGAVFLPAAGVRNGTSFIVDFNEYWSASNNGKYASYTLYIDNSNLYDYQPSARCYGASVRLVYNYNP